MRIFLIALIFLSISVSALAVAPQSEVISDDDNWVEVAIFVHGISPAKEDSDSDETYKKLVNSLKKYYAILGPGDSTSLPFSEKNLIFIRYGTLKKGEDIHYGNDSDYMTSVQRKIGELDAQVWGVTKDDPPSMLRSVGWKGVREILLYGVSDAFYYNSKDGGNDIRQTILLQILSGLVKSGTLDRNGILPEEKKLSITIFAHSLGGIVMYDILRSIFIDVDNMRESYPEPDAYAIVDSLHKLKRAGRLRVRKFYTFGTQISMMFLKYPGALKYLKDDKLQDISPIFPPDKEIRDPRWINFWDKDDILGYPFDFLFERRKADNGKIIKDIAVDAGDYLPHVLYWNNEIMSIEILKDFLGLKDEDVEFLTR